MENIFTTSKPFLNFAVVLGLFPLAFEGPARKGILKSSVFGDLLSCCSLIFLIFITVSNLTSEDHYLTNTSAILDKTRSLLVTVELFSYIFLFFHQLLKRENFLRFLNLIHDFDVEVNGNEKNFTIIMI